MKKKLQEILKSFAHRGMYKEAYSIAKLASLYDQYDSEPTLEELSEPKLTLEEKVKEVQNFIKNPKDINPKNLTEEIKIHLNKIFTGDIDVVLYNVAKNLLGYENESVYPEGNEYYLMNEAKHMQVYTLAKKIEKAIAPTPVFRPDEKDYNGPF